MFGPIKERWFGEGGRREIKERREEGKGKRDEREVSCGRHISI